MYERRSIAALCAKPFWWSLPENGEPLLCKTELRGYGGEGIVSFPAAVSFFPQFLPPCVKLDASWSGSSPPTDR